MGPFACFPSLYPEPRKARPTFIPFCGTEPAVFGEGLLSPEQTLSHIGTWVLFLPLLPLHVSSG